MAIRAVPVELGGRSMALRFDMEAMAAVEDKGFELDEILAYMSTGKLSAKRLRVLLWAMLQHENDAPSEKDVGSWVDGENFVDVVAKIGETLKLAFPKAKAGDSAGPQNGAGTGTHSSASLMARSA